MGQAFDSDYRHAPANQSDSTDEVVIVDCRCEARRGVPFGLRLTNLRLSYERLVSFKMHRSEWRHSEVALCDRVRFRRRSPWLLWIAGAVLTASGLVSVVTAGASLNVRMPWLVFVFAIGCFVSGRRRFVLEWHEGDRRHRVVQPMSTRRAEREAMTEAMREVARYLQNPEALAVEVARLRALAFVEPFAPTSDERRLCPDGACVGILDADGRCKICGASPTTT